MLALAVSLFIVLFLIRKGTKVRTASRGETGRGERRGWAIGQLRTGGTGESMAADMCSEAGVVTEEAGSTGPEPS